MRRFILNLVLSTGVLLLLATPNLLHASGWLGVTIEPPSGVQIGEIIKGGPADLAGLKNGDRILSINGQKVLSIANFIKTIASKAAKDEVELLVVRQGEQIVVKVLLDDSNNHRSVSQNPFYYIPESSRRGDNPGSLLSRRQQQFPDYSVPTNKLQPPNALHSAQPYDHPQAWLGIAPGATTNGGVAIKGVAPNGPGAKAGLKPGDIVIAINGNAVATPSSLVRLMGQFKADDLVEISLTREGKPKTLQAKMAVHPLIK